MDYKYYENDTVDTQPIIEAVVYSQTFYPFLIQYKDQISSLAQNPDNPQGSHSQNAFKTYAIMKQPHPDFVHEIKDKSNSKIIKLIFNDVKLKSDPLTSLPLTKGFLSLVSDLSDMDKELLMKRLRGDMGGFIKQKENVLSKTELDALKSYLNDKTLTTFERYSSMQYLKNKMDMDVDITSIACTRIVAMSLDKLFDDFYTNNIENQVDITTILNSGKMIELFPKNGQKVNLAEWKVIIEKTYNLVPQHIKDMMSHNYYKWKMLEL